MKHIKEKCNQEIYESAQWKFYFDGLRVGVLDIETTGLNPARNKFILGCINSVSDGVLHQVLAESREEEAEALNTYMKLLDEMDVVVTYNGRHFDIPFIEKRAGRKVNCYDLDLFQVINGHSPIKKLVPNLKQKTIENYMGFWDSRADEISGAESVELFNHFEATGDPEAEKKILLHNNDDVRQLTRLTKAIIKSDFHKAMFKLGYPVKQGDTLLTVKKTGTHGDSLIISGKQLKSPINYMGFEFEGWPVMSRFETGTADAGHQYADWQCAERQYADWQCAERQYGDWQHNAGTFEIRIPLIRQKGLGIVDLRAAGIDRGIEVSAFASYPVYGSGFLVIEEEGRIKHRETNHFVKEFLRRFMEAEF